MAEELFIWILLIIFAGVLSLSLCLFSHVKLKNAPGVRHYKIVTLLSAVFAFAYAFELASTSLKEIKFWLGIEYYVMPFIPSFILFMCFEYVGVKINRSFFSIVLLIPLLTVFAHHTNELHHLYYLSMDLRNDTPFPIAEMEYGPFFYVHSLYLFLCLSISVIILLMQLKKSLFRFKLQILTMVAGLLVPVIANSFYLNDLSPYGIDLGPVSMSVSFILHGIALLSFQMFYVLPIAREKVFENMLEGVIVLEHNGAIVDYNNAILSVLPMLNSFSIGKHIETVLAEDRKLADLILQGEECDHECVKDGQTLYFQVRFSPVMNKDGITLGTIVTFVNITERVEMQEKLRHLASFDGLTNIYNRTYFMEQSIKKLDSIEEASLVMFDIDHFKVVNDTYGHDVGDIVLSHVANLAKNSLRPQDIIGRYGGEEFIILLPTTNVENAFQLADTIRGRISEGSVSAEDYHIDVTSSFGIAYIEMIPGNQQAAMKQAVKKADHALYAAKKNGRNIVQTFKEDLPIV